jgi:succinyl-CoA synthetase alpha subunit
MKQAFIIIFFFAAWGSFAQNTSVASDKRVMLPALVVESTDAGNPNNIIISDAVPLTGQKYETSQQHTLMLVPVGNSSGAASNSANAIILSTATPLPGTISTTSQSTGLTLIPVEE